MRVNRTQAASNRRTASVACGLFALSSAMPIMASVAPAMQGMAWVGWLDVLLAAALVSVAVLLRYQGQRNVPESVTLSSYRVLRILAHIPLLLMIVFLFVRHRIDWTILLVGLAWRSWLFCATLPIIVAALQRPGTARDGDEAH